MTDCRRKYLYLLHRANSGELAGVYESHMWILEDLSLEWGNIVCFKIEEGQFESKSLGIWKVYSDSACSQLLFSITKEFIPGQLPKFIIALNKLRTNAYP